MEEVHVLLKEIEEEALYEFCREVYIEVWQCKIILRDLMRKKLGLGLNKEQVARMTALEAGAKIKIKSLEEKLELIGEEIKKWNKEKEPKENI